MSSEIRSLTSLRGIAALSVMLLHLISTYPFFSWVARHPVGHVIVFTLTRTPLSAVFAGDSAVILFFVLSGFVLALPFVDDNAPTTASFIMRRVCRIYFPYAATLLVVLAIRSITTARQVPDTTHWFAGFWVHPITAWTVIGYLAMTGASYHINNTDFVTWSLVHEMRISLLFPLLMWSLGSIRSTASRLAVALLFSAACMYGLARIGTVPPTSSITLDVGRSLLDTGHYVWLFVAGIELARHRQWLVALAQRLPPITFFIALVASLFLYCAQGGAVAPGEVPPISIFLVGTGSVGIVVLAIVSPMADRILVVWPCVFLGEISYSLYLMHPVILLGMMHGLDGVLPGWLTLSLVPLVSVGAAWLMRRYIELPSIAAGRKISGALRRDRFADVSRLRVDQTRRMPDSIRVISRE
jgi:peptidoglycan/LPS O-acetylase OafA/YrhL